MCVHYECIPASEHSIENNAYLRFVLHALCHLLCMRKYNSDLGKIAHMIC